MRFVGAAAGVVSDPAIRSIDLPSTLGVAVLAVVVGDPGMAWALDPPAEEKPQRPRVEQIQPPAGGEDDQAVRPPAYLGVTTGAVPDEVRAHLELPEDAGLVVTKVVEGSPAAKAGLEPHDILLEFDGQEVGSPLEFAEMVERAEVGRRITLSIVRRGKKRQVHIVPERRPAGVAADGAALAPAIGNLPLPPGLPPAIQQQAQAAMAQALAGGAGAGSSVQIRTSVTNGVAESTAIASDAEGTVEIRVNGPKKNVSIRDADGKDVYSGPLVKEADFDRIPEAWRDRVQNLDARLRGNQVPAGRRPPRGVI
ncbi:MAG: S1C family serine protease [Planctomycetia bacterium]